MISCFLGDTGGSINNAGVLPVYPKNGDRGTYCVNVNFIFMNENILRPRMLYIHSFFRKIGIYLLTL